MSHIVVGILCQNIIIEILISRREFVTQCLALVAFFHSTPNVVFCFIIKSLSLGYDVFQPYCIPRKRGYKVGLLLGVIELRSGVIKGLKVQIVPTNKILTMIH